MSTLRKKKDNIHIRVEPEQKEDIKKAAELLGLDLSSFVLQNSLKAARAELAKYEQLSLSRADADLFYDAISNPPNSNKNLKSAYKKYQKAFNPE
ncbi:type II toxin-antitoxin system TacA family antitoxin [Marinicella gelatinilytica]|uniref:type II toxin-antitoxin system TacA family antitoxin n=1 Tax=Marinicella gelatinilytica TaxID=2996017 RepID=UPI0022608EA8|nr:DUF1778 domain-containing protein [Marinicella gelatinilytica]MCX7544484.1 DUF1778 domain-containing protein [Marinicella gelatinilytica]